MRFFCLDLEAKKISKISAVSRSSVNKIIKAIRIRIAEICKYSNPLGVGKIEINESYFGAKRACGLRGKGAGGKTLVFGILKRNGKVYMQIVKSSAHELISIIKSQIDSDSTMFSDSWKSYNGLADFGYKSHYRIRHGSNEFAKSQFSRQDGRWLKSTITSMVLKTSWVLQELDLRGLEGFTNLRLNFTSKNVDFGLIIGKKIFTKLC